jgi:hypothetical protein
MDLKMTRTPHIAMSPRLGWLKQLTLGIALCATGAHALADSPYQKGPAPTVASLEATGPFAIAKTTLPNAADYGNGTTVYYPTNRTVGSYGLLVICPGFVSTAGLYSGIAQRIASHGFVVTVVATKSLLDQPKPRAAQMIAAMNAVLAQNKIQAVPYAGQIDAQRVAFSGHSAGGAGTFYAAATNPQLKALVGLMPGEPGTDFTAFAGVRIPTLLLTAEGDSLANSWSTPYYASLDPSLPAAKIELAGLGHLSLWSTSSQASQGKVAKYVTAWIKRFVDDDTRYTSFISTQGADMSAFSSHGGY